MKAAYLGFYLDGREAKLLKNDIDPEQLAEAIAHGGKGLHEVIHAAASAAAKALEHDRHKRNWLRDNEDEIKEAGGSQDEAWQHYVEGRVDELVYSLGPEVLEALEEEVGDDEDEDEDDDEEEDGEEEE